MTLVVDSSVASKWVLAEEGSERAIALRDLSDDLIAPTLLYAEIGNALWKRVLWNELSGADASSALAAVVAAMSRLCPLEELAGRALALAGELRHPIYDCFYLALAEREQCPCITADKRLLKTAAGLKSIEVRAL